MRALIFVGYESPSERGAGSAVLHRHIRMCLDDATPVICVYWYGEGVDGCINIRIPARAPGWLPVRKYLPFSGIFRKVQEFYWLRRELRQHFVAHEIKTVLTTDDVPTVVFAIVASFFAWKPVILLHDVSSDFVSGLKSRIHAFFIRIVLLRSFAVGGVSEQILDYYKIRTGSGNRVLYPMPAAMNMDWSAIVKAECAGSTLGVFGTFYSCHRAIIDEALDVFLQRDFALNVVCQDVHGIFPELIEKHENISARSFFSSPEESFEFLAANACGLIFFVDTLVQGGDWLVHSFPSRIIQAIQLGCPILIITRGDSAARQWAESCGFDCHVRLGDQERFSLAHLDHFIGRLSESSRYVRALSAEIRPEAIHRSFMSLVAL